MENLTTGTNQIPDSSGVQSIPIEIEREFVANVEQVWKAWTNPEYVKQWWGPESYSCPEAKMDFREGGTYLFAMKGPDGTVAWSGGLYEEILPFKKIVYTDQFMDKDGNVVPASTYGMEGEWEENVVTLDFHQPADGGCRMVLKHEGIPASMHDDCIEGWNSSLDKMQKLVEHS